MDDNIVLLGSKLAIYESAQDLMKYKLRLVKEKFNSIPYSATGRLGDIKDITSRIKSEQSIREKLLKNNYELTYESVSKNIKDVVGFRIICMYEKDIYIILDLIKKLGYKVYREKDYIANPKPSGYRSYHLTMDVPIDLEKEEKVHVEIQIRTDFMDLWASREHDMVYKTNLDTDEVTTFSNALVSLSGALNVSEAAMESARVKELTLKNKH